MQPARSSRRRRRLIALALGSVLALLAAELGLRWLVLSDSPLAARLGSRVRHAEYLASPDDEDFWKLECHFVHSVAITASLPDELTGWRTGRIEPDTREHIDAPLLGDRTPVLLYGDSFAEGAIPGDGKFEGMLELSPLHAQYALLNYGVGGFGADQVLLMARDTLPRWQSRRPVAIVALLVDDDLDRTILGFRSGPKPRFRVERGVLVDPGPVEINVPRYMQQHPIRIVSYLYRLLVRAPGLLPRGLQAVLQGDGSRLKAEKLELSEAILRATCRELRAHSSRCAILITRCEASVSAPQSKAWQEQVIRRVAGEEGVPVLDSRDVLLEAARGSPKRLRNFYVHGGPALGHWNQLGNLVVFQSMRAFLEGGTLEDARRLARGLLESGVLADEDATLVEEELLGGRLTLSYREDTEAICTVQSPPGSARGWYMGVRAGNLGPSRISWKLPADARRVRFSLRASSSPEQARGVVDVVLHAGRSEGGKFVPGEELHLRVGDAAREWTLTIDGTLELQIEPPTGGGRSPWVLFSEARLD
ncbi:MAG: SGNH/GDSL hydrolase family protein [Planctomycetes bacterium]|nr:SGNH/GDSL hydrolase family protein [Planctomycetota bacterium]